jgi:formate dehydrogenase iron-sulfur subunit
MSSDVCKHCTHAACLDVCPTGALFRTEFRLGGGAGRRVQRLRLLRVGLPLRRHRQAQGGRPRFQVHAVLRPAQGGREAGRAPRPCPTESIQFGPLDELRERAHARVERLRSQGIDEARLYGESPDDGVGGDGAFFLLLDQPEVYGLPPDPVVTTRDLPAIWGHVGVAALTMLAAIGGSFIGRRR